MGALGTVRAEEFRARYDNWDDPTIPPFHYGTHYSSSATVLYYLLRLEPYTKTALELQGYVLSKLVAKSFGMSVFLNSLLAAVNLLKLRSYLNA
jgi:hypothetical protein